MRLEDQSGLGGAGWSLDTVRERLNQHYRDKRATLPKELEKAFSGPVDSLKRCPKFEKKTNQDLCNLLKKTCDLLWKPGINLPDEGIQCIETIVGVVIECRHREKVRAMEGVSAANQAATADIANATGPNPALQSHPSAAPPPPALTALRSTGRGAGPSLGARQLAAAQGAKRPIPTSAARIPDGPAEAAPAQAHAPPPTCVGCSAFLEETQAGEAPVCAKCRSNQAAALDSVAAGARRRTGPALTARTDVQVPQRKASVNTRAAAGAGAGRASRLVGLASTSFYGNGSAAGRGGGLNLFPEVASVTAVAPANGGTGSSGNYVGQQMTRARATVQKLEQRQPQPQPKQPPAAAGAGPSRRLSDDEAHLPAETRRQSVRQRRSAPPAPDKADLPQEPINLADSSDEEDPEPDCGPGQGAGAGAGPPTDNAAGSGPSSEAGAAARPGGAVPRSGGGITRQAAARDGGVCVPTKDFRSLSDKLAGLKCCFPREGGKDSVEVAAEDLARLEKGEFLNDTCIDFYIKYLDHHLPPDRRDRYHFFNSFFLKKLQEKAQPVPGAAKPKGREKSALDHERVKKWTKHVDLFSKDYIFVPIHGGLHWSLVLICHPGNLPQRTVRQKGHDESLERSQPDLNKMGSPLMLHLDSLDGTHAPQSIFTALRAYLQHEWQRRVNDTQQDSLPRRWACCYEAAGKEVPALYITGDVLPGISLTARLPKQDNHFDCGLFLLSYIDFFTAANPLSIEQQGSNAKDVHAVEPRPDASQPDTFLQKGWFRKANAGRLRDHLRALICELLLERMTPDDPRRCSAEGVVSAYRQRPAATRYLKPAEYLQYLAERPHEPEPMDDEVIFSDDATDADGEELSGARAMTRSAAKASGVKPSVVGPLLPGRSAKRRKVAAAAAVEASGGEGDGAGGSQPAVVDLASPEKALLPAETDGATHTQRPESGIGIEAADGSAAAAARGAGAAVSSEAGGEEEEAKATAWPAGLVRGRSAAAEEEGLQPGPSTQPRQEERDVEMAVAGVHMCGEGEEEEVAEAGAVEGEHDPGGTMAQPAKRPRRSHGGTDRPVRGPAAAGERTATAALAQRPAPAVGGATLDGVEELELDGEEEKGQQRPGLKHPEAGKVAPSPQPAVAPAQGQAAAAAAVPARAASPWGGAVAGAGGGAGADTAGAYGFRADDSSDGDDPPPRPGRRGAVRPKRQRLAGAPSAPVAAAAAANGQGEGGQGRAHVAATAARQSPPHYPQHPSPPRHGGADMEPDEIEGPSGDNAVGHRVGTYHGIKVVNYSDDDGVKDDEDDDPERLPNRNFITVRETARRRRGPSAGKKCAKLKRPAATAKLAGGRPADAAVAGALQADAAAVAPPEGVGPGTRSHAAAAAGKGSRAGRSAPAREPNAGSLFPNHEALFFGVGLGTHGGFVPGTDDTAPGDDSDGDGGGSAGGVYDQPEADLGLDAEGDWGSDERWPDRTPAHEENQRYQHHHHDHHGGMCRDHRHEHGVYEAHQQLQQALQGQGSGPGQAAAAAAAGGSSMALRPSDSAMAAAAEPLGYRKHLFFSDDGALSREEHVPISPSEACKGPAANAADGQPQVQQHSQTVATGLGPESGSRLRPGQGPIVYGIQEYLYGIQEYLSDDDIEAPLDYRKLTPPQAEVGAAHATAAVAEAAPEQQRRQRQPPPSPPPLQPDDARGHRSRHQPHDQHQHGHDGGPRPHHHHHHRHGPHNHQSHDCSHSHGGGSQRAARRSPECRVDGRQQQSQGPSPHGHHHHHHYHHHHRHDRDHYHGRERQEHHPHHPQQPVEGGCARIAFTADGSTQQSQPSQEQRQVRASAGYVAATLDVSGVAPPCGAASSRAPGDPWATGAPQPPPKPCQGYSGLAGQHSGAPNAAATTRVRPAGGPAIAVTVFAGQWAETRPGEAAAAAAAEASPNAPELFGQRAGSLRQPPATAGATTGSPTSWGVPSAGREQGAGRLQLPPVHCGAVLTEEVYREVESEYNFMAQWSGPSSRMVSGPGEPRADALAAARPAESLSQPQPGPPLQQQQQGRAAVPAAAAAATPAPPPAQDKLKYSLNVAKQQVASRHLGQVQGGPSARGSGLAPGPSHPPQPQPNPQHQPRQQGPATSPDVQVVPPPQPDSDPEESNPDQEPSSRGGAGGAAPQDPRQPQEQSPGRSATGAFLGLIKNGSKLVKDWVAPFMRPQYHHQQPHGCSTAGVGLDAQCAATAAGARDAQPPPNPLAAAAVTAAATAIEELDADRLPVEAPSSQVPLRLELAGPSGPGVGPVPPPYITEQASVSLDDVSYGVGGGGGAGWGGGDGVAADSGRKDDGSSDDGVVPRGGGGGGGRLAGGSRDSGVRGAMRGAAEPINLAASDDEAEEADEAGFRGTHAGSKTAAAQQQQQQQQQRMTTAVPISSARSPDRSPSRPPASERPPPPKGRPSTAGANAKPSGVAAAPAAAASAAGDPSRRVVPSAVGPKPGTHGEAAAAQHVEDEAINISDDDDDEDDGGGGGGGTAAPARQGHDSSAAATASGQVGEAAAAAAAGPEGSQCRAEKGTSGPHAQTTVTPGEVDNEDDDVIIRDSDPEDGGGGDGDGSRGREGDDDEYGNDDHEFLPMSAALGRIQPGTRSQRRTGDGSGAGTADGRSVTPLQQQRQAVARVVAAAAAAATEASRQDRGRQGGSANAGTPAGAGTAVGFSAGVQPQSTARNLQSALGGGQGRVLPLSLTSGRGRGEGGGGGVNGVRGPSEPLPGRGADGVGGRARGAAAVAAGGDGGSGGGRSAAWKGSGRAGGKGEPMARDQATLQDCYARTTMKPSQSLEAFLHSNRTERPVAVASDPYELNCSDDEREAAAVGRFAAGSAAKGRK